MRVSSGKIKDILWYVLIFCLLHITGSPFYGEDKYKVAAIFILFLIVAIGKRSIRKTDIYALFALTVPLLGTMTTNLDFKMSSYGHFWLVFFGALLVGNALPLEKFSKYYTRIMVFLAAVSLIVWSIYLVYPKITNFLPTSMLPYENDMRVYVNGAFLYTFLVPFGYGSDAVYAFNRNNGIFWEPGAYQFFLIYALILLLEKENDEKKLIKTIILIVTLFTTGSTTGMLCMIGGFLIYRKEIKRLLPFNSIRLKSILIVLLAVIGVACIGFSNLGSSALNKLTSREYDLFSRIGFTSLFDYFKSDKFNLFFGMGVSNQKIYLPYCDNTILYSFIALGCVFGCVFIYLLHKSCRRNFDHYLGTFLLFIFSFTSQVWILKFFVISIIFIRSDRSYDIHIGVKDNA